MTLLVTLGELLHYLVVSLLAITPWVIGAVIGFAFYRRLGRDFIVVGIIPLLGFIILDLYIRGTSFSGYCCDNGDGVSCAQPGIKGYVLEHILGLEKPPYSDSYEWWPLGAIVHGSALYIPAVVVAGAIARGLRRKFASGASIAIVTIFWMSVLYLRHSFFSVSPPMSYYDCRPWSDPTAWSRPAGER